MHYYRVHICVIKIELKWKRSKRVCIHIYTLADSNLFRPTLDILCYNNEQFVLPQNPDLPQLYHTLHSYFLSMKCIPLHVSFHGAILFTDATGLNRSPTISSLYTFIFGAK